MARLIDRCTVAALELASRISTMLQWKPRASTQTENSQHRQERTRTWAAFKQVDQPPALCERQCCQTAHRTCPDDDRLSRCWNGHCGRHKSRREILDSATISPDPAYQFHMCLS